MKTLILLFLLLSSVSAQALGVPYGPSYPGQPGLLLFGNASAGGSVLALTPTPPQGPSVFLLGFAPSNLPVSFGQTLLVVPDVAAQGQPSSSGVEDFYFFAVPAGASVTGLHAYFQVAHVSPTGYLLSRGVDVTFQ